MVDKDYQVLKLFIQSRRLRDKTGDNKQGVTNYDMFMIEFLPKFKNCLSKTKLYVRHAFMACDLDGDNMCNLNEIKLLCKHLEPGVISVEDITKVFHDEADLENSSGPAISFDKFAIICANYNLFTDAAMNKYLGSHTVSHL